ncbi:MAG: C1 family peptidase [Syntrophobacteraceae bacterium]
MKKIALIVIAAILFTIPSLCGAMDFHDLRPGMAAKIQALRDKVRAKGGTYEVGYSAAMDKPIRNLAGLKAPLMWKKNDAPSVPMLEAHVQATPNSYDWRTLGGVTPIKNQGYCGSCWAFGTVGPLESQIQLKEGVTVDLSEQYLLSCNLDNWDCDGGWFAHDYHMNREGQDNNGPGAVEEADKPYAGRASVCGGPYDHPYRISNWAYVGSRSAVPTVQAIKQAIYTYGPIGAAVYVGPKFQAYSRGIFNTNEVGTINHAIVLVGWVDDLGPDKGYWILRNSWGASWGESGYMRIRYGVNKVGYGANFIEYAGGANPTPTPTPPPPVVNKPDLTGTFTNLKTNSSGRTLTGNFLVQNIGNEATANSFRVLLYLSTDGSTNETLVGSSTIRTSIRPGYYVNLKIKKSFSKSVKGKYLIAVVDPDGSVPDSDGANNVVISNCIQSKR